MPPLKALLFTAGFLACYVILIDLIRITVTIYRKIKNHKTKKNENKTNN